MKIIPKNLKTFFGENCPAASIPAVLLVCFWAITCSAKTAWEVSVIFLGAELEASYQADADRNVMELARLRPSPNLKLSLLREFPDKQIAFFPDPDSKILNPLQSLLFHPVAKVEIAGDWQKKERSKGAPSVLQDVTSLKSFFKKSYGDPNAKRMLIIYGHGLGYEGLEGLSLTELTTSLSEAIPARTGFAVSTPGESAKKPIDLLWLDSCFMASAEVAMELRPLVHRMIGSQEAEFSSGAPFDVLQEILEPGPEDSDAVGIQFAERFLESYSFSSQGKQTGAVAKSSATISVLDLEKFSDVLQSLKRVSQSLRDVTVPWKDKISPRVTSVQMEKSDLVDLGSFALLLKGAQILPAGEGTALRQLLAALEIEKEGKLKTNPRVLARAPKENSHLVFGYGGWQRGYWGDDEVLEKLPANLQPVGFSAPSDGEKRWPYRKIHRQLFLSPFTVGFDQFDYFFADSVSGNVLSAPVKVQRLLDFVTFTASRKNNPILFTGYTQGIGKVAERYCGLNLLNPLQGVPSVEYLDLAFYRTTDWANF